MSFFTGSFESALAYDPEFLLRASMTYNWDVLLPFCDFLIVAARGASMEKARRQLVCRDQWGNTPLHGACYNAAPVAVIQKLIQCAVVLEKRHSSVDISGSYSHDRSTPILAACVTGISLDALRMLVRPSLVMEYENDENERNDPVVMQLIDRLDSSAARAVARPDARGCTPFSELAIAYDIYLQNNRTSPGDLPLSQVRPGIGDDSPRFIDLWEKWETMLRAGTARMIPWISPVHAAAVLATALPPIVSSVICRCYPAMVTYDGSYDCKSNIQGSMLPLHLLVSTPMDDSITDDDDGEYDTKRQSSPDNLLPLDESAYQIMLHRRTSLLQTFLDMDENSESNVSTCPILLPNGRGNRSVFCQAIAEGRMTWSLLCDYSHVPGPLQRLWHCDRSVISVKDIVTGLYPFQLAATVSSIETKRRSREILELDTIYALLRLHPQLVQE